MKILVIDVETTAINPSEGEIVEFGGVLLDTRTGNIEKVLDMIIKPLGEFDHNAWIFQNSDLTPEAVLNGEPISYLYDLLALKYAQYPTVAFNGKFDFGWLAKYNIVPKIILPDDPMYAAMYLLKIPSKFKGRGQYKFPSVQECLTFFGISEKEPHRAMKDAELEAQIILKLIETGAMKLRPSKSLLSSNNQINLRLWSKIETYEHLLNYIESNSKIDIHDLFDLIVEKLEYCQKELDSEVRK